MNILMQLPTFLSAHTEFAYAVLFALSLAETLIGVGFFVYGELIFIPAAALAGLGVLNIWLVAAALILGGVAGDGASFWIGSHYGARFLENRKGRWARLAEEKGEHFFEKYGPKAAFFARFMGPLSWVTPFFAGIHGMSYRDFFIYNTPGVALGIGQFIAIGYFFGQAYRLFVPNLQFYEGAVIVIVIVGVLAYHLYNYARGKGKIPTLD